MRLHDPIAMFEQNRVDRCIGEQLARLVLRVGYEVFLSRIPDFTIPSTFVPRYETGNTRHMVELPLRFSARAVTR